VATLSARSARLIAVGLAVGPGVSNGLARFAYGLVLPAMRQDLHWSYTEAGWINTTNALGYLLGAGLTLVLVAKNGPRRLFIGGMVLTTIALLASDLTRDFWLFSPCRFVADVAGAPVLIAGSAMVSTLFSGDSSRDALAIALYFGGAGLGMVLTGLLLPLILVLAAWPQTWLLLAGLSGLGPRISTFRGHICVHCRYGPVTRNLPKGDFVDGLQDFEILVSRHPAIPPSKLQGSDFCPWQVCLLLNTPVLPGRDSHIVAHRPVDRRCSLHKTRCRTRDG
jgi:MFS family permease